MPSFNDRLAAVYDSRYRQLIGIAGFWWKHEVGGNWLIVGEYR